MTKINIEIIGQGPPLILIHGWGWHSGIWHPLVADLKQKFKLFLIDLPGFGKSTLLDHSDYSIETISKAILPHVPSKAAWLGWSLGGQVAWWHAIHYPDKISHLITIASSPKFTTSTHWPGISPELLDKFHGSLMNDYTTTMQEFIHLQIRGSLKKKELFLELNKQLIHSPKTTHAALKGGLMLLKETDLRIDLKKINCPSLHIFGQNDTLVPVEIVPLLKELSPSANIKVIERAGHIPFLSHSDIFLQSIDQFF